MSETETVDFSPALKILDEMGRHGLGDTIPLLQRLQETYGYLPREVVFEVSRITGIPASQFFGVATFYEHFHFEPRGRHLVRCCRGTACHVRGGHGVIAAAEKALGVREGETTEDRMFTLETVACLGACALAPVVVIDDKYQGQMTPRRVESSLRRIIKEES
jgi:NADH-quinone oxidoreductase subunit E